MLSQKWLDYIKLIESEIKNTALCPCCGEIKNCDAECTIEEDIPSLAKFMFHARQILASRPKGKL